MVWVFLSLMFLSNVVSFFVEVVLILIVIIIFFFICVVGVVFLVLVSNGNVGR